MTRRQKWFLALGIVIALLVGVRLALPSIVLSVVNKKLAELPGYRGHVEDVDIALIRGAYEIHDLDIEKVDGASPMPFVSVHEIDISLEWKQLLNLALVGEIELHRPTVNFVNGSEAEDQAGGDVDWREAVKGLVPVRINRFAVYDGVIHYVDVAKEPDIDVHVSELYVDARNLTNSEKVSETMAATIGATGKPMDYGRFELVGTIDPYADTPTFDMNASIRDLPLKNLNEFIKGYGRFDVEAGRMEAYAEVAAADGKFTGYVKPLFFDVEVLRIEKEREEDQEGPLRIAWEALVGAVTGTLENKKVERVAIKVPVEGSFDDPEVDAWAAVGSTLQNAFLKALFRGLDQEVEMRDLRKVAGD